MTKFLAIKSNKRIANLGGRINNNLGGQCSVMLHFFQFGQHTTQERMKNNSFIAPFSICGYLDAPINRHAIQAVLDGQLVY